MRFVLKWWEYSSFHASESDTGPLPLLHFRHGKLGQLLCIGNHNDNCISQGRRARRCACALYASQYGFGAALCYPHLDKLEAVPWAPTSPKVLLTHCRPQRRVLIMFQSPRGGLTKLEGSSMPVADADAYLDAAAVLGFTGAQAALDVPHLGGGVC